VLATIPSETLGNKSPVSLTADAAGRVYVLLRTSAEGNHGCNGVQADENNDVRSLAIIESSDPGRKVSYDESLPAGRWDDLALASDGRLFLTRVLPFDRAGVYVFDTAKRKLQDKAAIPGSAQACPVDLALAEQQNELFVSYECGGPGGWAGHDSIGIYCLTANKTSCASAYDQTAIVSGMPNVGGPLSVSPDESYLWAYGDDACSSRAYDHKGCPTYDPTNTDPSKYQPTRIVNVVDTDSLIARTYAFPLGDDGKYVSFSNELEAYVSGQNGIKVITKPGVGQPEVFQPPKDDRCGDLKATGDVKFSQVGATEYMYAVAGDANAVCVFERAAPSAIAASGSPVHAQAEPGKMYAVVIGIKAYMHGWSALEYPTEDAAKVAAELKKDYGFEVTTLPEKPGCKDTECYVTKDQVIGAFKALLYENSGKKREFGPQDQLLVYITGHGDRWPDNGPSSHPYLVTSDSKLGYDESAAATEVDYRKVWELVENSNIRHALFVVDTCVAGSYDATFWIPLLQEGGRPFLRVRPLPEALQRNTGLTRKYLSASPLSKEEVPDKSPFAEGFVQALEKLRSSAAGYFTFDSVLMQMASLDPQPRPSSFSSSDTAHGDFIFVPYAVDGVEAQRKSLASAQTH
jgi:hypothetical protein